MHMYSRWTRFLTRTTAQQAVTAWSNLRLCVSGGAKENSKNKRQKPESGDGSVVRRRTRDWKVAGSNPCRSGGRIFFSRSTFCADSYPFHPRVTAAGSKRSRSFCRKCRWQVTDKHAYTLRMYCGFAWSDMVHGCTVNPECPETAAVSCGTSHVSVVSSTQLGWIFKKKKKEKNRYKKLFIYVESHASAVSLLESEE